MTATTATIDRPTRTSGSALHSPFFGALYRFHGFDVVDCDGERVGIVDWIWADETTGAGDHIGLQLQWLRGKARGVPAAGCQVDCQRARVHLPFAKRQIASAPRFAVDRALSCDQRAAIAAHFTAARRAEGTATMQRLAA